MAEDWVRYKITAELLADAHFGTGSGGGGIDALLARDRHDQPVIWASHVEGVLRDAARRLRGDQIAGDFFGRPGGVRQRALFTSLYTSEESESRIWRSAARQSYNNRAPKDDTLRVIEFVPKGTKFVGEVELPKRDLPPLQRLVQEIDALGSGRASGAGRLTLSLEEASPTAHEIGTPTKRLKILLKNCDPLCITATATPDNLIPSLAFVPGRALLGALADWLIIEGDSATASLLTSGRIATSDALPLPQIPTKLEHVEVLPAPLSLQSEKPKGFAAPGPWWTQSKVEVQRVDALKLKRPENDASMGTATEKLKRPQDDLFTYRIAPDQAWMNFRPARRVRLRNGRSDSKQADTSLFAIEQIVEETYFLAEVSGSLEDMECFAQALAPILEGRRWLRIGRSGAPVEIVQLAWLQEHTNEPIAFSDTTKKFRLVLTADLLMRDDCLRWRTELDKKSLSELLGINNLCFNDLASMQDWVMVHGFNGTARLWRMPAAAIRRGSVFEVSGSGVVELARRAARGEWLGERTHEGFGRFRLDDELPGITNSTVAGGATDSVEDVAEEAIAAQTHQWFIDHEALAKLTSGSERKPSLSQWLDLVTDLERGTSNAINDRLHPTTVGARGWKHADAQAILKQLVAISDPASQARHAQLFVRWLRAAMRKEES
jgi:hypothetical protein